MKQEPIKVSIKLIYFIVKMSDNFLKIARKEIQEELDSIQQILIQCNNDADIFSNAVNIEKHLHKIKGLAPMMGQEVVGQIAKTLDAVLKYIIEKGVLKNSYKILAYANQAMKEIFDGIHTKNVEETKKTFQEFFDDVVNH